MKKPGYIFWSAIGFVLVIGAVLVPASVPSRLAFAVVGAALLYTRGPRRHSLLRKHGGTIAW